MKISTNGVSLAVFIVSLFTYLGFSIEIETVNQVIGGIFALISLIGLLRNQWNRSNVKKFFFKE